MNHRDGKKLVQRWNILSKGEAGKLDASEKISDRNSLIVERA
ncbi:hypothetical protein OIU79_020038, partial [Salix purpurea]